MCFKWHNSSHHVEIVFFRIFRDYGSLCSRIMAAAADSTSSEKLTCMSGVIEGHGKELLFSCMNVQCDWSEAAAKCVSMSAAMLYKHDAIFLFQGRRQVLDIMQEARYTVCCAHLVQASRGVSTQCWKMQSRSVQASGHPRWRKNDVRCPRLLAFPRVFVYSYATLHREEDCVWPPAGPEP